MNFAHISIDNQLFSFQEFPVISGWISGFCSVVCSSESGSSGFKNFQDCGIGLSFSVEKTAIVMPELGLAEVSYQHFYGCGIEQALDTLVFANQEIGYREDVVRKTTPNWGTCCFGFS